VAALAWVFLPAPAPAQDSREPMSGAAFEAYSTGKTLLYSLGGTPYGAEEYLPGRRVRWSLLDGRCAEGVWHEAAPGQICFFYENDPTPACWHFYAGATGLEAVSDADPALVLREAGQMGEPLRCLGPEVGV